MTPQDIAGYLATAVVALILAVRIVRQRLIEAATHGPTVAPITLSLEDLKKLLVDVDRLRAEVEANAIRMNDLEDRLDKRDRRVGFLEARVDELTELVEARDRTIAELRVELGDARA